MHGRAAHAAIHRLAKCGDRAELHGPGRPANPSARTERTFRRALAVGCCGPPRAVPLAFEFGHVDRLDTNLEVFASRVGYGEKTLENASNLSTCPRRARKSPALGRAGEVSGGQSAGVLSRIPRQPLSPLNLSCIKPRSRSLLPKLVLLMGRCPMSMAQRE